MKLKVNTISDQDLTRLKSLAQTINNDDIDLNRYRNNIWNTINNIIQNCEQEGGEEDA